MTTDTHRQALPQEIARTISKEDLANLAIHRYEGPICLVASQADLDHALQDIRQESVVGFDTETRPVFKKGQSHLPCLAQVASHRAVYLFQIKQFDSSKLLTELLESANIIKAGVAMADDLRHLKRVFPFEEKNIVDLGVIARHCGLAKSGVRNLAGMFLQIRIPKGARTTNWDVPQLSQSQTTYAATDAWICRELFLCFKKHKMIHSPKSVDLPG